MKTIISKIFEFFFKTVLKIFLKILATVDLYSMSTYIKNNYRDFQMALNCSKSTD